jgi:3-dehydroquinate synthase
VSSSQITVNHSAGSYPIEFVDFEAAMNSIPAHSVIVTDENVQAAWGSLFPASIPILSIPPGESSKSLARFASVVEWLASTGVDRQSSIVAIGGGVVGDLAGFVAATYMRGVPYTQVPTSLLAQVDSSVGGKVAVDTPEGKNLVGAFYPPQSVFISSQTLATLPERHFTNGMAEVWKYGYILDADLVALLEEAPLQASDERLEAVVRRCVELKTEIVEQDEFDRTGKRAILNFGHTVGHALEQTTGYGPVLHGEAVAVGMVVEAVLGERMGVTQAGTAERVKRGIVSQGLPTWHEGLDSVDDLLKAMWRDKKVQVNW